MSKQPEALLLADWLDHPLEDANFFAEEAAAELRRLHAVNAELLEALKLAEATFVDDHFGPDYVPLVGEPLHVIRAAIAKATGEQA